MQQELVFDENPLPPVKRVEIGDFAFGASEDDLRFALGVLDAFRIKINHAYDKLSSLSNSRTRLLPHQIEATHRVVNAVRPRFLLADEVGLGKTVEAGLIIKELIFRRGYNRVLVSVPAPLVIQWQQEMKSKFNEFFGILNRKTFHDGSWQKHDKVITSIDFIKNERYGNEILRRRWDIGVFDEAHRLRRDYSKVTHAYAFAEKLAEKAEALLLLSATPFRGKLEELFFLLRLIDPHVLGPYHSFVQEHVLNLDRDPGELRQKIGRVLIRRRKVEVGGFTKRHANTIRFELSPEERELYDSTTEYVRREYNLAMREKNTAVGFVMIVFQKLLDSSTRALLSALEKRKHMLESLLHGPLSSGFASVTENVLEEDWDDLENPEDLALSVEERRRKTTAELRREILTLKHLIKLGRSVPADRKLQKLRESLLRLRREGSLKFIIFTQFKTTLEYLAEALPEFKVVIFHGSMSLKEKEEAIEEFKTRSEILISTEAGGEGRNLQFANILVNYDLPWSPLKIEQRIGRVHRFGQKKDVLILNFSTRDTVAERVLEVLEQKIKLFEDSIGPSDALLGAIDDESDFQKRVMEFVSGAGSKRDFDEDLESQIRISREGFGILNELVAPQRLDFNLHDYYDFTQATREVDNEAIAQLTLSYLRLNPDAGFSLEKAGSQSGNQGDYLIRDLDAGGPGRPATFKSSVALEDERVEFLAVGHPMVDRALMFFLVSPKIHSVHWIRGVSGLEPGVYGVFICRYAAGKGRAELLSCLIPDGGGPPQIPEEIIVPSGSEAAHLHLKGAARSSDSSPPEFWNDVDRARQIVEEEAKRRAVKSAEDLRLQYDKEEYKIEVSFAKKIRGLEERRDIQQLRCRTNSGQEHRALLAKIENQLVRARVEKEKSLMRVKAMNRPDVSVELVQVYRIAGTQG